MNNWILRISFLFSIIGIILLFFLASVEKYDLNKNQQGKVVSLEGKIVYEKSYGEYSLFRINSSDKNLICKCRGFLNAEVEVIGKVEEVIFVEKIKIK